MATRNPDATRARILEAATAEFSAFGIAGARVDRIAASAGCSKNLIYIYFADKETLFATVLKQHLSLVYESNDFTPDDLPAYAGRAFDYAQAHPDVMRLMAWFTLEQQAGGSPAERAATMRDKIAQLGSAQAMGQVDAGLPPAFLIAAVMSLATGWSVASPFGPALDPESLAAPATLRANVVELVRRITRVPPGE